MVLVWDDCVLPVSPKHGMVGSGNLKYLQKEELIDPDLEGLI